jgi:hypothetical protein
MVTIMTKPTADSGATSSTTVKKQKAQSAPAHSSEISSPLLFTVFSLLAISAQGKALEKDLNDCKSNNKPTCPPGDVLLCCSFFGNPPAHWRCLPEDNKNSCYPPFKSTIGQNSTNMDESFKGKQSDAKGARNGTFTEGLDLKSNTTLSDKKLLGDKKFTANALKEQHQHQTPSKQKSSRTTMI